MRNNSSDTRMNELEFRISSGWLQMRLEVGIRVNDEILISNMERLVFLWG